MIIINNENLTVVDAETEKKLRFRIFIGFSSVTLITSALFRSEGYDSSLEFGRKMESIQLHENANHVVSYINKLDNDSENILDLSNVVEHLHTPSPAAVILKPHGKSISSLQDIDQKTIDKIISHIKVLEPSKEPHHKISDHEELCDGDECLVTYDDQEYNWMMHNSDKFGQVLVIQKHNIQEQATSIVIPRLVISSIIVIWLGFWASFGVAMLISKWVRKSNRALLYAADYNQLLGIPNSSYLISKLESYTSGIVSLIFISVENLETVEQLYGNSTKDKILSEISDRLKGVISEGATVGVFKDKVFYLLLPNVSDHEAYKICENVTDEFIKPILSEKIQFSAKTIQGLYSHKSGDLSVDNFISAVSYALSYGREQREIICVYNENIKVSADRRNSLNMDLSSALENSEFILHYQPKIDLSSKTIIGVEALVRWEHPILGLLFPGEFIDLVETSTISKEFTKKVIDMAIAQSNSWEKVGYKIPIAINITPYDLKNDYLMKYIEILFSNNLDNNKKIEFELTEFETNVDINLMANAFDEFKRLGIHRSIDDYGTGMCTLAYLKDIPIDTIKIDHTFIFDLDVNLASKAITESTIKLAKELNCTVVAEGIENKKIASIIKDLGCDVGQGYYYSRPVSGDEILVFMAKQ